ncbi:unnamed protein product [Parnassius mnemosyne]|uniref:FLYWCH-type domain-containing protein n=1 Tax=Parnassius mnemosyne TaxID=213953 RepID=A0AAV1K7T8_9NEOP
MKQITSALYFSVTCELISSKKTGRMMIKVGGYVFSQRSSSGTKKRWVCSTHVFRGCRAQLYTVFDQIVKLITLIKTKKGKTNIKVGEYTFYLKPGNYKPGRNRWCCTQNKYCRACLSTVDNKIVAIYNEHNHEKK